MKQDWKNHIIELLIVIIGISVAFWLNNVASQNNEKKLETKFIQDLRNDLESDSLILDSNIKFNKRKVELLSNAVELMYEDEQRLYSDSLIQLVLRIGNFDFFNSESFTLKSLLQSGDIKLISSDDLKKELLRLLSMYESIDRSQRNLLQALDDNYFPLVITKMDMITQVPTDIAFFYSLEVRNYCGFTISDTNNLIYEYSATLKQVKKVLEMMKNY